MKGVDLCMYCAIFLIWSYVSVLHAIARFTLLR